VPKLASLILKHDADAEILGLKEVAREDQPRMSVVFWSFRVMVGIGMAMLGLAWLSLFLLRGGKLFSANRLLAVLVLFTPAGFIATLAGWFVVEVGRQPWLVNGLYRTVDGASVLPASNIIWSLTSFVTVYSAIFSAFLYYLLLVIRRGPEAHDDSDPVLTPQGPAHPAFMPVMEEDND
jgi:cytochrome d ubiquinol oxidase subunit I